MTPQQINVLAALYQAVKRSRRRDAYGANRLSVRVLECYDGRTVRSLFRRGMLRYTDSEGETFTVTLGTAAVYLYDEFPELRPKT